MGCYRHLTRDDREEIAALRAAGHSMRAVAATVGKAPSSISRELKRNALDSGRYAAHVADGAYMARRQRLALLERDKRLESPRVLRRALAWTEADPELTETLRRAG